MNLYKVKFAHFAPKDSEQGIKVLVLAENDEQVYNWIASQPESEEWFIFNSWKEREEYNWDKEKEVFVNKEGGEVEEGWWNEEGEPENFKERILRLKGEIGDDSIDYNDAYYGITLYGWELLKENITTEYSELIELGVVFKIK